MIAHGIDLHKRFSYFYSVDFESGEVREGRVVNERKAIEGHLALMPGDSKAAIEATRNWYWPEFWVLRLVDLLQQKGMEVKLSNPVQTKAIAQAKVKTDKVDAKMHEFCVLRLVHLMEADLLPTCWIPDRKTRDLREFLRFRNKLVRLRTQLKNGGWAVLSKQNINPPMRTLWGIEGRRYLKRLKLPQPHSTILAQSLEVIDSLDKQISFWEKKILSESKRTSQVKVLCGAPGIGDLGALTILCESGSMERFGSARKYASYSGLVPTVKASGGRIHYGHLGRQANMVLRWIFIEIAGVAVRCDSYWRNCYNRLK